MKVYTTELGVNADSGSIETLNNVFRNLDDACKFVIDELSETMDEWKDLDSVPMTYIFNESDEIDDGLMIIQLLRRLRDDPDGDPDELEWYRIREFEI